MDQGGCLQGEIGVDEAERDLDGLVIWHEAPFAVGANLMQVTEAIKAGQFELLEKTVAKFRVKAERNNFV